MGGRNEESTLDPEKVLGSTGTSKGSEEAPERSKTGEELDGSFAFATFSKTCSWTKIVDGRLTSLFPV